MAIISVQLLVRGTDLVEQRVAGLRWTDIVLEPDIHDDRAGNLVGEVDAIEVGNGLLHQVVAVRMQAQVVIDLFIGIGMRQRDGIHETTEIWGTSRRGAHLGPHRGGGNGQATALTAARHANAAWLDLWTREQKVNAAPGVYIKPAVGIRMPIHNVIRQEIWIAGVELTITAELAPWCDGQRDIAFTRPLLGNRRVRLIARQEQHRRGPFRPTGRTAIPGSNAHVLEAGVEHLEDFHVL